MEMGRMESMYYGLWRYILQQHRSNNLEISLVHQTNWRTAQLIITMLRSLYEKNVCRCVDLCSLDGTRIKIAEITCAEDGLLLWKKENKVFFLSLLHTKLRCSSLRNHYLLFIFYVKLVCNGHHLWTHFGGLHLVQKQNCSLHLLVLIIILNDEILCTAPRGRPVNNKIHCLCVSHNWPFEFIQHCRMIPPLHRCHFHSSQPLVPVPCAVFYYSLFLDALHTYFCTYFVFSSVSCPVTFCVCLFLTFLRRRQSARVHIIKHSILLLHVYKIVIVIVDDFTWICVACVCRSLVCMCA